MLQRFLDYLTEGMSQDEVDAIVGPSTFTCLDCGKVTQVWRHTKPFVLGDPRLCEHTRDQEEKVLRVNTLRFG